MTKTKSHSRRLQRLYTALPKQMYDQIAITLDVDWAPDFVIDSVAEQLLNAGVRATWFVTHASPAIERLRMHGDQFELGIHPNFLPGSTQGNNSDEVLQHCLEIVPDAGSMRTHALVQSTPLLMRVVELSSVMCDFSLFLPHAQYSEPVEYWLNDHCLLRVPYIWEEDFEMYRPIPCWRAGPFLNGVSGLAVFDFHPIHVYLNSPSLEAYEQLKQRVPSLPESTHTDVSDLVWRGEGTRSFLEELLDIVPPQKTLRAGDIVRKWPGRQSPKQAKAA